MSFLYKNIFRDIKLILEDNDYDINDITDQFMLDFEEGLQKSIKTIFPKVKINGCHFHYVKILWEKAKQYGLCSKKDIKYTKILLFLLKLLPYLAIDERSELFNKIDI